MQKASRNGQTIRQCRCPFPSLLGVIFLEMCVCDVEWLFCPPRPRASLPDSESSFLFQILKLMEGRWTRAPSAMPAGQAGDESVFIHFRWRWRRTGRPTISISALDRFPIYGKKEEERGEGERGGIKAPFLPSPPLPSHLLRFKCLYPGWPLGGSAPPATDRTRKRGRATFDLEENSFRFCAGESYMSDTLG